MNRAHAREVLLWVIILLSNLGWYLAYHELWLDSAQTEGQLDEAQHYIKGIQDGHLN